MGVGLGENPVPGMLDNASEYLSVEPVESDNIEACFVQVSYLG